MIDGSKMETSFLCQNVVKEDRKTFVCTKVLFRQKMFTEGQAHKKNFHPTAPSRTIIDRFLWLVCVDRDDGV